MKYCYFVGDTRDDDMMFCYLRDKTKREADFVVIENSQPHFALKSKVSGHDVNKYIFNFAAREQGSPLFFQVHQGIRDYEVRIVDEGASFFKVCGRGL